MTLFEVRSHVDEFVNALAEAGHTVDFDDGRLTPRPQQGFEELHALGAECLRAMQQADSVFMPEHPVWTSPACVLCRPP